MRGFLMMGVVGFVSDRPGRGEATDDENTNHYPNGERLLYSAVTHVIPLNRRPPSIPHITEIQRAKSRPCWPPTLCLLVSAFRI